MDHQCIPANPDIAGIGVRVAIYAQNFLCFVPVVAHLWDGKISADEMKGIEGQSIGMLTIAFAILISTIIQAKNSADGQPMTSFHAAVILDLSWTNNTSTWIWFLLYAHRLSKADTRNGHSETLRCPVCRLEPGRQPVSPTGSVWAPVILSSKLCPRHAKNESRRIPGLRIFNRAWDLLSWAPVLILGSLHLSLMAAIGIWLWLDPAKFGTPIPCDPTLTIIGGPASFSSQPLRVFSLVMYGLLLIPGINLLPPISFFLALHIAYNWLRDPHVRKELDRKRLLIPIAGESEIGVPSGSTTALNHPMATLRTPPAQRDAPHSPSSPPVDEDSLPAERVHTASLISGLVLLVIINIIFVIDIELTLSRNKPSHLDDGDNVWGFGQVLALLLLVLPLRDAWNAFQDIQTARHSVQARFLQVLRDEVAATPIAARLGALVIDGADPRAPIKGSRFGNSLQLAAYHGETDIVEFLLNEGPRNDKAVIDTECGDGYGTALQAASANGQLKMVQLLLQIHRTDIVHYVNIWGGHYGSALCAACANGHIEVAQLLLDNEITFLGALGPLGSPLHLASLMGNIKVIKWLLENTNARLVDNDWGIFGKALDVAILARNREVIDLLTREGFWRSEIYMKERMSREYMLKDIEMEKEASMKLQQMRAEVLQFRESESRLTKFTFASQRPLSVDEWTTKRFEEGNTPWVSYGY